MLGEGATLSLSQAPGVVSFRWPHLSVGAGPDNYRWVARGPGGNMLQETLASPHRPDTAVAPQGRAWPHWIVLALACVGQFMVVLDVSVVNVALPSIHRDLGFSSDGLQWVVNAYTLTFAGFLLLGGRAADLFGRRKIFLLGLAVFSFASLLGGLAQDQAMLVAARALQGLGGAVLAPATLSIITTTFTEPRERARAMGMWSAVAGAGGAFGALFGGVLTDELSWRWILFINVPIGVAALVVGRLALPESRGLQKTGLDLPGAVLVTAGLTALVYGVVRTDALSWTSGQTIGVLAVAVLLLGGFLLREGKFAQAPLMPLRVFASRSISGANLVMFAMSAAIFPMWYLLTLYFQDVRGYSALRTGLVFSPVAFAIVIGAQTASRLVSRVGARRLLLVGTATMTVGMFLLSRIGATSNFWVDVLPGAVLSSLGLGLSVTPVTFAATTGVARHEAGLASGLVNTARQVGGSLGLAVLATAATTRTDGLLSGHGQAGPHTAGVALSAGFALGLRIGAGLAAASILAALVLPTLRHRSSPFAPAGVEEAAVVDLG
ncbi:MAG: drug resistance transporter, EmrB/QacA subfamily [Acidimicrobiaceae bacterium]|jgi:EmrB/QacA subfamily drug resistance transporter|nr:drug resistance transporter, EmrB/QacA subfamily [Acidimicrobiaceae bacterium]